MKKDSGSVALWDLLLVTSSAMFLAGGLAEAHLAKLGIGGYAVAVIVGLVLAMAYTWMVHALGNRVAEFLRRRSEVRESSYFLAMYLPLMIWIPTALFLGALVTVKLMRIMT